MADRGMKRICASCGTKFYDFGKLPAICPSCGAEFTGEVQLKSRRSRSTIAPDTVKRDEIEAKNTQVAASEDDDLISVEEIDEGGDDYDDDLEIDNISDDDNDDDLSDLDGDIDIEVEDDDR